MEFKIVSRSEKWYFSPNTLCISSSNRVCKMRANHNLAFPLDNRDSVFVISPLSIGLFYYDKILEKADYYGL